MIKEVTGDLVKDASHYDAIVHGVNCLCRMQSGIARAIRERFPEAYEVDQQTKPRDKAKLGTLTYTSNIKPVVVNAYIQFEDLPREIRHCDYDAVRSCMKAIRKKFHGKKIGLPKIGAGLAGGDWKIIREIIEEELGDEDVTIVIYKGE